MAKVSYINSEEKSQEVNEQPLTYGITADSLRVEMMREALKIEDTSLLREALEFIKGLSVKRQPPCQYSIEELKNRLNLARQAIQEGQVYTTDELRKRHPL